MLDCWQIVKMSLLLLASVAVIPTGQLFHCTPIRVWDGDGPIWCAEGPRVRLAGIAARELDGSCSPGHPCPHSDPFVSRDYLASLLGTRVGVSREGHVIVRGPALRCRSLGSGGGNRTASWCVSPKHGDISCAMVATGHAKKWDRYWRQHRCD
jgi:endonuclease YncB( thermonuclease family)